MVDQTKLWPLRVNWRGGCTFGVEFRTRIFETDDAREDREARRFTPRQTYEYQGWAEGRHAQRVHRLLQTVSDRELIFASPVYRVEITTDLLTDSFEVAAVPSWLDEDAYIVFQYGFLMDFVAQVIDVTGTTITIDAPVPQTIPAGTWANLGFEFWFRRSMNVSQLTTSVVEARCDLQDRVGFNAVPDVGVPGQLYKNKELLLMKPNWGAPVRFDYQPRVGVRDNRFSRTAEVANLDFIPTIHRGTYLERSLQDALDFVAFFCRMKGRQGEFYMPSWINELPVISSLASGNAELDLAGTEWVDFAGDVARKHVFVLLRDTTVLTREVLTMTTDGTNSTFNLDQNWGVNAPLEDILYAGWLQTYRFAVDGLEMEFLTDSVAQFTMPFQNLHDLVEAL